MHTHLRFLFLTLVIGIAHSQRLSAQDLPTQSGTGTKATRPNVVLVMTDDQGYGDLGLHGNKHLVTPNIDHFGQDGIQFTRFYVSPVCAPTRASLMTGRYHYRTGVIHTSRGGAKMFGDEITIAEILTEAGYRTGIFGKWHLGDNYPMRPQDQGFSECLVHRSGGIGQTPDKPNSYFDSRLLHNGHEVNAKGYCTDVFFDAALKFIEQNKVQPFFAYVPLNAPHTPLEVSDELVKPYLDKGLDETTAKVYAMVQNIDENFGRLLSKLGELKLRDNTLVIFLTDNGAQQKRFNGDLRGRKASVYEGGIRVPCFVQWPAQLEGRKKIDRIAAHIDLLPTIVEACAGSDFLTPTESRPRNRLDGVSLLPLLHGETDGQARRLLFFQCHRGLTPTHFQNAAVVSQDFKLVCSPGTFSREDFSLRAETKFELYNLAEDTAESKDVTQKNEKTLLKLQAEYIDWFRNVKSTRNFAPGVIHIGESNLDRIHLCRYQDATYRDGRPIGWPVNIVERSRYDLAIRRDELKGPLNVTVSWQGDDKSLALAPDKNTMRITLIAGEGLLSVTLRDENGEVIVISDNGTTGDVILTPVN